MKDDNIENLLKMMLIVIVTGGKGGIGKSLLAQIIASLFSQGGRKTVRMIDTDHTNSSTYAIDPTAVMANLLEVSVRGVIRNTLDDLEHKIVDHIVIDTGAQEDEYIVKILPWLVKEANKMKAIVVVARPISLSTNNQMAAIEFMDVAERLNIPTIFVRNHGQGRKPSYFLRHWHDSEGRRRSLDRGAVECILEDGDTQWADEAGGYGLSLADAALGQFEKAGPRAIHAAEIFTPAVQSWLAIWLGETHDALAAAMVTAIERIKTDAVAGRIDAVETGSDKKPRPKKPLDASRP